ncbi:M56 family metallopeptidase [Parasphingorhabdus sp.]|uniref:M56 family metallopeptidase n=1 Tax=Parasphingorhabdus sp. TaxID=2709688 RepID=UPI0032675613
MSSELLGSGIFAVWTLDTMVSMTLLMALVLLIRKPVSHFFGPHISYLLWILPLARLFMPTLTVTVPAAEVAEPLVPAILASDLAQSSAVQQVAVSAFASVNWVMIAVILWIGGAGLLFVSKLAGYFQFREDILADGQLVGQHGNIKILETAAVGGPLAFGIFDKYIAVPADFFRNYAPRERELALEHEIAHHRSGDLAANFVGLLILSLHWFNPVAWFAWIAFRQDQETACDARILQKSGREVRAVYGRTIAKSVSGHKLGLASPLNQKDKIKDRLKMLGQNEKSSFRKRVGAILVGAGTIVALPLTATVTYAVEPIVEDLVEPDVSVPVAPDAPIALVPPAAPAAPEPLEVAATDRAGSVTNITMLNGQKSGDDWEEHVHKVKVNGRTIILRTGEKLTAKQVRKLVEEAEKSRMAADQALREMDFDREELKRQMQDIQREFQNSQIEWKREVALAQRHAKQSVREAQNEVRQAQREAWQEAREAEQEAREADREAREAEQEARAAEREAREEAREAQREARWEAREAIREAERNSASESRKTSRIWSIANQVAEISFAPQLPVAPSARKSDINCKAMNKKIAFGGERGGMTEHAWAVVAGCGTFETKIDQKKMMKITLRSLKERRAAAAKSCDTPKAKLRRDLKNYDREIEKLQIKLQTI